MNNKRFVGSFPRILGSFLLLVAIFGLVLSYNSPQAEAASFVFGHSSGVTNDANGTTLSTQLTGVTAGSLIVVFVKYEGSSTTLTVSDGTNTFTADTQNDAANNDLHGRFFYLLSSTASGTVNYTATWGASKPFRRIFAYEYTHVGATASFDVSNKGTATSGSLNSGSITTTATDEVAFGSYGEYSGNNTTAEQIGGLAADQVVRQGFSSMWSKTFNNTFTGAATATGNSSTWIGNVIAFKITAGGPPPPPPPPPAFDFSMSNGGNKSVVPGSSVNNTITSTLSSGTAAAVSFTTSGLPANSSATYSPTSCTPTCSTTMTINTAANTPTGNSTIIVTGTSGALTHTTSFTLNVTSAPDTTPPTVSLSSPANNATVAATVAITANASDNVGVSGVQFLLDGANLMAEDTASPYTINWNTTTATAGVHTLSARARDAAGNTSLAPNISVTVDNLAPTGTIVINGGAAATNTTAATLTLSATDAISGVTQMRFSNTTSGFSAAENYATTKAWTLTTGTGTKTVYVQFKDGAGNWSSATISDTITMDTTAPTITAVASSNITNSGATITWTTNEASTSQIEYGLTTSYGTLTTIDNTLVTAHSVTLSSLASSTNYKYRVRSKDAAGNEKLGANNTFTTLSGPDTTPPTVPANVTATVVSSTQINLAWTASTDNIGVTGYNVFRDGIQIASPATNSYQNTGLTPATAYSYTISARDAAGNVSAQSAPANATTFAFIITNVQTSNITTNSVTIGWTTDQPATTQVEYGISSSYGTLSTLNSSLVTTHSQVIMGLTSNTTYHYRARSMDAASHLVTSGDLVFTTSPAGQNGTFLNEILVQNLNLPTGLEFIPNGNMLITQLGGQIRVLPAGASQISPTPFLTLTNIGTLNGQQGLMDMVLDPNFSANHFYYVFYTLGSPNRDRVSRFTASADFTSTVAGSEFVVYSDPQDAYVEHHGGALNFGLDGKLYITTGEHFNADNAQSLTTPRGKILRFNSDGTVPTNNPFYDGAGPNYDAIWAMGLRNPYRAYIDPITGKFYIGDVGGNDYSIAREEVNLGVAGANYGWPNCEGSSCGSNPTYTSPIYSYGHSGRDAAITGGFVYHGNQYPSLYQNNYFYADYTQNWIKRLTFDANGNVLGSFNFEPANGASDTAGVGDIVYLAQGPDGALYYVDLGFGDTGESDGISQIRRIRFISTDQPPVALSSANPTEGPTPLTVNFSSAGSYDPEGQPLTYLWTFGDNTSSTLANPSHTYTQTGQYSVRLTVSDEFTSTLSDPIAIAVGNKPVPTILTPTNGAFFRAGDVISFSGDGNDVEDGALPASAYTWNIDFLHAGHVHPGLPSVGVKNGTFTIPTDGHDFSGDVRYRLTLTLTDSDGLQSSTSVTIWPDKVNLTFNSSPTSGLNITIDGIPHVTPFVYDTLIGFNHTINAPNQTQGNTYNFASWSDGGAQSHILTVPTTAQSYTATFNVTAGVPFAFARSNSALGDAGSTTITTQLTNVASGSLIVAYVKWEGSPTTVTLSDGTNSFIPDAVNSASNNDLHGQFFYLLASSATGTVNYTATFATSSSWRRIMIYEYTYSGAATFDVSKRGTGTSGSLNTGSFTTTGNDEVVFGAYGEYSSNMTANEQVAGSVADQVLRNSISMWSKKFSSPVTGAVTATGNSSTWIGSAIGFKR